MWNSLPPEFRQLAPASSTSPLAVCPTLFHKKTKNSCPAIHAQDMRVLICCLPSYQRLISCDLYIHVRLIRVLGGDLLSDLFVISCDPFSHSHDMSILIFHLIE